MIQKRTQANRTKADVLTEAMPLCVCAEGQKVRNILIEIAKQLSEHQT